MEIKDLKSHKLENSEPYSLRIVDDSSGEEELIDFLKGVSSCSLIQIIMPALKQLPDTFRHIKKLEVLTVECDGVTTIPDHIQLIELRQLSFACRSLQSIPGFVWEKGYSNISVTAQVLVEETWPEPVNVNESPISVTLEIKNLGALPLFFSKLTLQALQVRSANMPSIGNDSLSLRDVVVLNITGDMLLNLPDLTEAKSLEYIHIRSGRQLNLSTWRLPPSVNRMTLAASELKLPALAQLPALRYMELEGLRGAINNDISECRSLEDLIIKRSDITHISEAISNCRNLKNLVITESIDTISKSILSITSLESLRIERNKIESFDNDWSALANVKQLSLCDNHTKITSLDFVNDLPKLDELKISGNALTNRYVFINRKKIPILYAGELFSGAKAPWQEIIAFGAALGKLSYTNDILYGFFDHFWNTGELLIYSTANDSRLVQALNISYAPLKLDLHNYLQQEYLGKYQGVDSLGKNAIVFIEGKTVESLAKIKETLQLLGIQYATKLNDNVTHIVIGKNPATVEAFNRSKYKYISEPQIFDAAEKLNPKFLNEQVSLGNTSVLESISAFLLSPEPANVRIGIQMLATGGVPDEILDLVLMLAKSSDDTAIRAEAKKILQIQSPASWKLLIEDKQLFKNINGDAKEQDIYHKLCAIEKSAGIESAAILSLVLFRR